MNRVVLQIPIDVSLRKAAEKSALEQGFSSLQEITRIFLKQLAEKTISVNFEQTVQLSPKAIKRYDRMTKDFEANNEKIFSADNVDDLMKHLNS